MERKKAGFIWKKKLVSPQDIPQQDKQSKYQKTCFLNGISKHFENQNLNKLLIKPQMGVRMLGVNYHVSSRLLTDSTYTSLCCK